MSEGCQKSRQRETIILKLFAKIDYDGLKVKCDQCHISHFQNICMQIQKIYQILLLCIRIQLHSTVWVIRFHKVEIQWSYPKVVRCSSSCDSCKFCNCNKSKQAKNIYMHKMKLFHFWKKQVFFVSQSLTASSSLL